MQLPIVEVKANKRPVNILEINIEQPGNFNDILHYLRVHPEIDTIWLVGNGPGSIKTDELSNNPEALKTTQKFISDFSNSLIALLKQTLQITRVIYNKFKITAEAHLKIEEELIINKNAAVDNLISLTNYHPPQTKLKRNMNKSSTVTVTALPNDASFDVVRKKIANDNLKRVSLKLDNFNFTSPVDIELVSDLCEEFPEIIGLEFAFHGRKSMNLANVSSRLKKLLCKLESVSIQFSGDTSAYDQMLSLLTHSTKLRNLQLDNLKFEYNSTIGGILNEILCNNVLVELDINFKGLPLIEEFSLGLCNNTSLQSLTLSGDAFNKIEYRSAANVNFVATALQSHPNIRSLCIYEVIPSAALPSLFELIEKNPSLETFLLPITPINETNQTALHKILQDNNSLREIMIQPVAFISPDCIIEMMKMLKNNFTLTSLKFGDDEDMSTSTTIFTNDATMTAFATSFPDKSFIRKLYLPLRISEIGQNFFTAFIDNVLQHCPQLTSCSIVQAREHPEPMHIYNIGETIEELELDGYSLPAETKLTLQQNKFRNESIRAISIAEKIFMTTRYDPDKFKKLQSFAIKLLTNLLHSLLKQTGSVHELIIKAKLILSEIYLIRKNHALSYQFLRACDYNPKAMSSLIVMLFGEDNKAFLALAKTVGAFTEEQLLQFYLILMSYCDTKDVDTARILVHILNKLNKIEGLETALLKDKYNAAAPISIIRIRKIAIEAGKQDAKLIDILTDKKLSYADQFKLLRAHPLMVNSLKKEFGSAEVICFEDLIINYKNPKTIYNEKDTWEILYSRYIRGEFYATFAEDQDLEKIREIATKCFAFFDRLYLSEGIRAVADVNNLVLDSLVTLSSEATLPWISAFIASIYTRKKEYAKAEEHYLCAANADDFSDIKNIKRAARNLEPWAINVLTSEVYLRKYPQLNLFIAQCYLADGKLLNSLAFYKKAHAQFPEIVVAKVKKLAATGSSFACDFLEKIEPKPISLLLFLGDLFSKPSSYIKALKYYKLADPAINTHAFTGIEKLANNEVSCPEAIFYMAERYRAALAKLLQDKDTEQASFDYNYRAAKLNNHDAIEFLKMLSHNTNAPVTRLYLVAGVINVNNPGLAKDLLLRIKKVHPIANLEVQCITSPPKFGEREQALDCNAGENFMTCLENYFRKFPQNKSQVQENIANDIANHFNQHRDDNQSQALFWLREYTSRPEIINHIKGELARMLSCAMHKLKHWHQPILISAASMKP